MIAILEGRAYSGARGASSSHGKVLTSAEVVLPIDKEVDQPAI